MQTRVNVKHIKSKTFTESESFKKLRTNIQFSGKNMKAIAFTSTYPGEGKSEISYRVAYSLAEMGKKTIFVDSDLRNSTFTGRMVEDFQGEFKGLVHYLVGENTAEEVIVKTQNPNFDFIPIGAFPPNPSELLAQEGFAELIETLKQTYDYIIIDTPPAGYVVDGVIVANKADGVIFLMASGGVSAKAAKETVSTLSKSGCKLLGTVVNKCNRKSIAGHSYDVGYSAYGYGGYGYAKEFASDKSTGVGRFFRGKK